MATTILGVFLYPHSQLPNLTNFIQYTLDLKHGYHEK